MPPKAETGKCSNAAPNKRYGTKSKCKNISANLFCDCVEYLPYVNIINTDFQCNDCKSFLRRAILVVKSSRPKEKKSPSTTAKAFNTIVVIPTTRKKERVAKKEIQMNLRELYASYQANYPDDVASETKFSDDENKHKENSFHLFRRVVRDKLKKHLPGSIKTIIYVSDL